jgi:hypothetical protein
MGSGETAERSATRRCPVYSFWIHQWMVDIVSDQVINSASETVDGNRYRMSRSRRKVQCRRCCIPPDGRTIAFGRWMQPSDLGSETGQHRATLEGHLHNRPCIQCGWQPVVVDRHAEMLGLDFFASTAEAAAR